MSSNISQQSQLEQCHPSVGSRVSENPKPFALNPFESGLDDCQRSPNLKTLNPTPFALNL